MGCNDRKLDTNFRMEVIDSIFKELNRAEGLHPDYPADPFRAVAIIGEEVGELQQAILDCEYKGLSFKRVEEEAVRVAAMGLRFCLNFPALREFVSRNRRAKDVDCGAQGLVNPIIGCGCSCKDFAPCGHPSEECCYGVAVKITSQKQLDELGAVGDYSFYEIGSTYFFLPWVAKRLEVCCEEDEKSV